jgi:hypothetical protein
MLECAERDAPRGDNHNTRTPDEIAEIDRLADEIAEYRSSKEYVGRVRRSH